jgi:demethylmenaquinone methyltransferase/2-methoxy-6-polyprenyl-1,4-benzoquinol methylase
MNTRPGSGQMFDAIAGRYDALNRLLSVGLDQLWRRRAADALGLAGSARVLDIATGTADLAIRVAVRHPKAIVIGIDPSRCMLEIAEEKVRERGLEERIELCAGDAEELPFDARSFDAVCIAFGIRNVVDRPKALREMARVVRTGGKVAVLELCDPEPGIVGALSRRWVHGVVPWLGGLVSGASEYRYLSRSIAAFPPPTEFAAMMERAGLGVRRIERLGFGAACLFVAEGEGRA